MNERLLTIWRRSRPATLVAAPLLALGVTGYLLIGAKGPHTASSPQPEARAATTPTVHTVAAVPHLTPTAQPPVPTRTVPASAATSTSTPQPRAKRLHTYQSDGRRAGFRSAPAHPSKAPTRRPARAMPGATPPSAATGAAPTLPAATPAAPSHPTAARVAVTVPDVPVRLRIPALNVDTHVESVGLNGDAMDVPANPWDVAWFKLGPQPGMAGNAVIDGHLDTATGPAVFLHLGDLRSGDLLYVTAADGVEHAFKVTALANYPVDNAPLDRIFGASKGAHLNLITCSGDWLPQQHIYNERLVVYSTLVA